MVNGNRGLGEGARSAARALKNAGDSLPGPVKKAAKRILERSSRTRIGKRLQGYVETSIVGGRGAKTNASALSLPLSAAGSSYSEEQISTILQYETAYLKSLYFRMLDERDAARGSEILDPVTDEVRTRVTEYLEVAGEVAESQPTHLVFVHRYPREGDEYGNGFVHRRIKHYQAAGAKVHVVVIGRNPQRESYVYEGVHVITGGGAEAAELLRRHRYTSVSTHFLHEFMWEQIAPYLDGQDLYCFVHGFEARRWVRSLHNYGRVETFENELAHTVTRQRFWRHVANHRNAPKKYVFVSKWWARASQEDMELVIPNSKYEVIHNLIDLDIFRYVEKPAEQRFKILWIRSASNRNYGNDIAVRVLKRLRNSKYWPQLRVLIIGDGTHFHEFETAFADDGNVEVRRGFVDQYSIAELHREYGVFLVPTRLDSQGVSRDEAMASGLVTLTNDVAAVSEFADSSCAIVAEAEDDAAMAKGMIEIFENPQKFQTLSRRAAERVRNQSSQEHTVIREINMMGLADNVTRERGM